MGMFDNVKCERVMPDGFDGRGRIFQTKDFDCDLDTLEITEDGRLMLHPYAAWGEEQSDAPEELDFHGWFNFYGYGEDRVWHEYRAKFTDGRLVEIRALEAQ